jgi:AcrR family transcriptional regulator
MPSFSEGAGTRSRRLGMSKNGVSAAGRVRVEEIQRTRLVAAMVDVVAEHGLPDATVGRVVARAGVSRRTFYELFEDRETCFLAALDDAIARASDCVLPAYESGEGWTERLRLALASSLSFLDVERGAGQLLIVGSLEAGAKALKRRQRVLAQMITAVDAGRKETKKRSEPPPLTAEGVVGGALSVIHARLLEPDNSPLLELIAPLMSMVVLPYLGTAAARGELERPVPKQCAVPEGGGEDPLRELGMRLTYRTVRVLMSVAANPGCSNREIGETAGIVDQGQISKLLTRLERLGLVHNKGLAPGKGAPNAWTLTSKGQQVERAMSTNASRDMQAIAGSRR